MDKYSKLVGKVCYIVHYSINGDHEGKASNKGKVNVIRLFVI